MKCNLRINKGWWIICLVWIMMSMQGINAQGIEEKATWKRIATPFATAAIDGSVVDLQAWLDSGFCVVIDYSACWCSSCWILHQSGLLEELYSRFGAQGSNRMRVAWCETDQANTIEQIYGHGGGGFATQGDWTNGGSVPYPIIDSEEPLNTCVTLFYGTLPYVVFIAPDGRYRSIYNVDDGINLSGNLEQWIAHIEELMNQNTNAINEAEVAEIKLWPNPASEVVNIEVEGLKRATLMDVEGNIISCTSSDRIDIKGMKKGAYLVQIDTEKGKIVRKIIKE